MKELVTKTRSKKKFKRDADEDSDQSVKAPQKKKTKQGVLHDIDDDNDYNDDDGYDRRKITRRKRKSEADPNTAKTKKKNDQAN